MSINKRIKKIAALILGLLLFTYMGIGAAFFWGKEASTQNIFKTGSGTSDIVIVFAGARERIKPAYDLVLKKNARKIVISPAEESAMQKWSEKYANGASIPHILETKSTSTHENAYYCAEIVKREKARKIILITSYYHMERSHRLLSLALRGYPVEILCYSMYPYEITDPEVLNRTPFFRTLVRIEHFNMVFNYLKFLTNGCHIEKCNRFEHFLEKNYSLWVKRKLNKYEMYRALQSR